MEAQAALVLPAADCFSEWAASRVASKSMISSLGRAPASQARERAFARAVRIASSWSGPIDLITRWAVDSEATCPNRASWPARTPRSVTQSPPSAIETARSRRATPVVGGSALAGRRHRLRQRPRQPDPISRPIRPPATACCPLRARHRAGPDAEAAARSLPTRRAEAARDPPRRAARYVCGTPIARR